LNHALWRDAFGADPAVLGRAGRLDGRVYTIAGVLPPSFRLLLPSFPREVDVFKVPDDWWQNGDVWTADAPEFGILKVLARLRPEATLAQAKEELAAVAARYRETHAAWARAGLAFNAAPLHESVVGKTRPSLVLLFGAVGLVLLVACANVASLLLVRSESRRREIALRMALGAARARIVRMLFAESLWLATLGGVLGTGVGILATRLLARLEVAGLPRSGEISVDASTLGFALLLSVSSTLLFGLAPAWRTARRGRQLEVHVGRATLDPSRLRANHVLVVGQLAVSLVLLAGAGLLGASLARLQDVEPGFEAGRALTFWVTAPGGRYARPLGTDRLFRALEDRVRALPGVEAAGVVWPLPLSGRV
jgi:putative ABC transport system permease protein